MSDLTLRDDLAERLREIAGREDRPIDELVESLLLQYETSHETQRLREFRMKLYEMARDYWQTVGDEARLSLSDEELDQQFWLIDQDGVPRLKSDEGQFELDPDPFDHIIGVFDDDLTDLSNTVRETQRTYYQAKDAHAD